VTRVRLLLGVAAALAFGAAACGGGSEDSVESVGAATQTAVAQSPTADPSPTPTRRPTPSPEPSIYTGPYRFTGLGGADKNTEDFCIDGTQFTVTWNVTATEFPDAVVVGGLVYPKGVTGPLGLVGDFTIQTEGSDSTIIRVNGIRGCYWIQVLSTPNAVWELIVSE